MDFSVLELKEAFASRITMLENVATLEDIENTLFYLSRIEALYLEGGFLVIYNTMDIERLEKDNKKRYKVEDYKKLDAYYDNKVQQIHIVGEYAQKMINDYKTALQFVDDYFQLNYSSFLNKYFKGDRQKQIRKTMTRDKFRQLFGELSPSQMSIINDRISKYIVVAAGPGSGKTRVLVHKLASLLLMEDVKHEQLLMLTFSRSAATEFKKRLLKLYGNAAHFIDIKTFHSYCFDILGRVGNLEKSDEIIRETIVKIKSGDVVTARITKTVLVIDEAQDMDANEYEFIKCLMEVNEDMRVIAVGDDDQNIYEFRGSSSEYMKQLICEKKATVYELVENYRSKSNLVEFTNQFSAGIRQRLKRTPIQPVQKDFGKIQLVNYPSRYLVTPVVNDILKQDLAGSTCILTRENDEALQITGLLVSNGMQAKLIQSNESFSLYNLLEIRYFIHVLNLNEETSAINDDVWEEAKAKLKDRFGRSSNFEISRNLIKDFECTHPKIKYKTDLNCFIRESRLEDFYDEKVETIFVSTMHKAKGREFDNVFVMLDGFYPNDDERRRLLYVAMTRAKKNLTIHYNGRYLDYIKTDNLERVYDKTSYMLPCRLALQLSYKDVFLDFFISNFRQRLISELTAGDELAIHDDNCLYSKGQAVLKFSKRGMERIQLFKEKNYIPTSAKIRYTVFWKKENTDNETKIILPELFFETQGNQETKKVWETQ